MDGGYGIARYSYKTEGENREVSLALLSLLTVFRNTHSISHSLLSFCLFKKYDSITNAMHNTNTAAIPLVNRKATT